MKWDSLGTLERRVVRKSWNLVLRWTTHSKSPEEVRAFLASQCFCSAQSVADDEHDYAQAFAGTIESCKIFKRTMGDRFLGPFVLAEFMTLYEDAITRCKLSFEHDAHLLLGSMRRFGGDQGDFWPRCLMDLMPHGRHGTLCGILQWFQHGEPSTLLTKCLVPAYISILHFGSPIVLPRLVSSGVFLLHVVLHPIQRTWSRVNVEGSGLSGWNAQALACYQANKMVHNQAQMLSAIATASNTFPVVSALLYRQVPQAFFDGMIMALDSCQSIESACSLNQHPQLAPRKPHDLEQDLFFKQSAKRVLKNREVDIRLDDKKLSHLIVQQKDIRDKTRRGPNVWVDYVKVIHDLCTVGHQICSAPLCSRSALDTRLRRCRSCSCVHYCSRYCQKRAWIALAAPHREVCDVIAALARDYEIPKPPMSNLDIDQARPRNLLWFPPRARLVIRHMDRLKCAQARATLRFTGEQPDAGMFRDHQDWNTANAPMWRKVDLKQYKIVEW